MRVYRVGLATDKRAILKDLGVEEGGISIMSKKMELFWIMIRDLKTPAANILKQDALSIGAELAVPRGTVTCSKKEVDCLLIANEAQLRYLSKKELSQPFGLSDLAKELKEYIPAKVSKDIQIMGVINANSDSFYPGSRYSKDEAIKAIWQMIEDGANIIDIGGVSSRPGSKPISEDEELERVKDIIDTIKESKLYKEVTFSIDSYRPKVVEYALDSGFGIINDIMGASDDRLIELAVEYGAKYAIMHMRGTPSTMQQNPYYDDVVAEVDSFFSKQVAKCEAKNLTRDNIILDVGIGFGKRLEDNIALIRDHANFLKYQTPLLIGASRKSMIDMITPSSVDERLPGTLAIHLKAIENGATIIRCHDVKEHYQAIKVWSSLV